MIDEIIIKLKKLKNKLERVQGEDWHELEITPAQARIIFPIVKTGEGHTMQELADMAGVDKALVSRTVASLEKKGYLERDKKSDSERNYKIVLGSKCKQFIMKKNKQIMMMHEKLKTVLTEEDWRAFEKVIDKLMESNLEIIMENKNV